MTTSIKARACGTPALHRASLGSWVLRALSLLFLCALVWVIALRGGALGLEGAQTLLASMRAKVDLRSLLLLMLIYATTLALPFVPGMELGALLMVALGPRGVVLVYVASLVGLSVSFAVGRWLSARRAPTGLSSVDPALPRVDTTGLLHTMFSGPCMRRWLPARFTTWLATHRYLALAIGLNLPGNMVIGGGGGIALLCGLSRQYRYRRFVATIAVAISPLPILVLIGCFGPVLPCLR
jgi:hypothetical protein